MTKKSLQETPKPTKVPSASDVAEMAGVSRTQVSFVLNGTGDSHVSKEKRDRILKAMQTLNYHPMTSAQALRKGFSKEFCLFFPFPYPSGINTLLSSIHEIGLAESCVVAQYSWNGYSSPNRMRESFETMLARKPMGIFCSLLDLTRAEIEDARARGIDRILVLDVEDHKDLDTFYLPKTEVGQLASRYLLGLGHRRIAVLHPSDPVQKRPFRLNLKGMKEGAEAYPDAQFITIDWAGAELQPSLAGARAFVSDLLTLPKKPSAVYAHSDDYALPLIRALHERGIAVPRDISVLGTDDLAISELSIPSLSTIKFDGEELGRRAVTMINNLITGSSLGEEFHKPPVPVIIERESTMPPTENGRSWRI